MKEYHEGAMQMCVVIGVGVVIYGLVTGSLRDAGIGLAVAVGSVIILRVTK